MFEESVEGREKNGSESYKVMRYASIVLENNTSFWLVGNSSEMRVRLINCWLMAFNGSCCLVDEIPRPPFVFIRLVPLPFPLAEDN